MTGAATPDQIKTFLDEVLAASLRNDISIAEVKVEGCHLEVFHRCVLSLNASSHPIFGPDAGETTFGDFDLTQLSNHERMQILGNRSPDLARKLREAYMAGARSEYQPLECNGPEEDLQDELEMEKAAEKYAAEIMGGQG